jgi:glycosyltransferase involved in cell wall biosynthesis
MRVVQLLTQATGGPVDHAVDVAVELARRGHDSHLIGPPTARRDAATAAGVTWHPLHMSGKRDVGGGAAVARRLRRLRPDVAHLQDRRAGWLGRVLAPTARRTASVYTLHGVPDSLADLVAGNARIAPRGPRDRRLYLDAERVLARWSGSSVVVPSRAVADYAVEHIRLPVDRVHVVPNGVDPAIFSPGPRSADGAEVRAVWLGLLAPVKRVDLLLGAVSEVPGVSLTIAGDGPLRDEVRRRIDSLGLAERVTMLGSVDDPAPVLRDADLFVLTSAAENCPLSLLQAMASGLPVVTTAVGGIPEVVREGVDGLLCPPEDDGALVSALAALVDDRDLRLRMGRSGRVRIESGYTVTHCVDGLLEVYDEALSCTR